MNHDAKVSVGAVAAAAGVSPSTVSRALRNHSDIPPATRKRIQAVAGEMGYRPDPLISALLARRFRKAGGEIDTIAYVMTFSAHAGFSKEVFEGASGHALKRGYRLEPFRLKETRMTGRRMSEILVSRGIRGLLIPPLDRAYGHLCLQWEHFACATVGYSMIRPAMHRATPHHFHNMLLGLRALRKAGFRRIGMPISAKTNSKVGENFLAAALFYQQRYGKRSLSIFMTRFKTDDELRLGIRKWVRRERPDCVFGPFSPVLQRCLQPMGIPYAAQRGSDDDFPHIDEKPRLIGAVAVDIIIGQIQRNEVGIPADPKVVMVEGRWVDPSALKKGG